MSLNSLQNYDKSLVQPNFYIDFARKSSVKVYAESSKKAGTVVVSAFIVIIECCLLPSCTCSPTLVTNLLGIDGVSLYTFCKIVVETFNIMTMHVGITIYT